MFLSNVSQSLRDGGVFFGTVAGGKQVLLTLGTKVDPRTGKEIGANDEFRSKMLVLKKKWKGTQPQPFGSAYTCAITDTVTEVCTYTTPESLPSSSPPQNSL